MEFLGEPVTQVGNNGKKYEYRIAIDMIDRHYYVFSVSRGKFIFGPYIHSDTARKVLTGWLASWA